MKDERQKGERKVDDTTMNRRKKTVEIVRTDCAYSYTGRSIERPYPAIGGDERLPTVVGMPIRASSPINDRRFTGVLSALVVFLLLTSGCNRSIAVERVIDGDTIVLVNGEKIRYLGIDTPETRFSPRGPQYFADEATAENRRLVEGKNVRLEFDVERRDIYGRLLAYVFVDTVFVNAELVRRGYARTLFFSPNNRYRALLTRLEKDSRNARLGVWAAKP